MYKIADPATRFCSQALKNAGGRWEATSQAWVFRSVDDALDGLYALYAATRASAAQRETLASLIEEGIAAQAWDVDLYGVDHAAWLASLSRETASRLIAQALAATKVMCCRPLEERRPPVQDDRFDTSAFERVAEARRARVGRSQGAKVAR
jgi:hypothetical protein